jgi:2,3-bisphosphoglycerate-independent phosphoglycerate mutase
MKFLMIILDGAADVGEKTPFETAVKPHMDSLAKKGTCGLLDIGYKGTPESDFGYLNLLGFYSKDTYPGRGYLEALGLGMEEIGERDVCVRGNFATLSTDGSILDRRAGRDETGLDELAAAIDGVEIDGVHFFVRRSTDHRVVVIMRPLNDRTPLSEEVETNDPRVEGVPVLQFKPKPRDAAAKFTASVLNKFVSRTHKILSASKINGERRFPANVLLLRGFGGKRKIETFKNKYGMKSCCIGGIAIVRGVASFLGMDILSVRGATGYPDTNLEGKFEKTAEALKAYDFVLLHINGADILSHDGKRGEKTKFIEKIDVSLGAALKKIDPKKTVVIITSDHRTASEPSYKEYRHTKDPVPVLVSGDGIAPGLVRKFDEKSCERGFLLKGNDLLPFVLRQIK